MQACILSPTVGVRVWVAHYMWLQLLFPLGIVILDANKNGLSNCWLLCFGHLPFAVLLAMFPLSLNVPDATFWWET